MVISSPPSEITFSQVREDVEAEREVLRRVAALQQRPLRVLVVASGGCSALALLADPRVATLDAVDPNPAQLQLTRLRAQAVQALSVSEQLTMLGGVDGATPHGRLALYRRMRDGLPDGTRAFWDARTDQIAFGLNRVGRFEQVFRELAAEFTVYGLDPVERPAEALIHRSWPAIFDRTFRLERLVEAFGRSAVQYSSRIPFAEHFSQAFADALQRYEPSQNYFLYQIFRDAYPPGPSGRPAYLQPEAQAGLAVRAQAGLSLYEGSLRDLLGPLTAAGAYDLIQISNITDWMSRETMRQLLAEIAAALAPGGSVIARRLNGDYDLAEELAQHLVVDRRLSARLLAADRSFIYRELVVAGRPVPPARPPGAAGL